MWYQEIFSHSNRKLQWPNYCSSEMDLNGLTLTNSNYAETMKIWKCITNSTFSYREVQNLCKVSFDSNLTKIRPFYD